MCVSVCEYDIDNYLHYVCGCVWAVSVCQFVCGCVRVCGCFGVCQ